GGGGAVWGRMCRGGGLATLLLDHGYQTGESLSHMELAARLPCRLATILRLETLAQELILRHETFDQLIESFVAALEGARAAGHVGLKSIIAYRTGLGVAETARGDPAAAFPPAQERARGGR